MWAWIRACKSVIACLSFDLVWLCSKIMDSFYRTQCFLCYSSWEILLYIAVLWVSSFQLVFVFVSHQEWFAFQPKFQLGRFCNFSLQNLLLIWYVVLGVWYSVVVVTVYCARDCVKFIFYAASYRVKVTRGSAGHERSQLQSIQYEHARFDRATTLLSYTKIK